MVNPNPAPPIAPQPTNNLRPILADETVRWLVEHEPTEERLQQVMSVLNWIRPGDAALTLSPGIRGALRTWIHTQALNQGLAEGQQQDISVTDVASSATPNSESSEVQQSDTAPSDVNSAASGLKPNLGRIVRRLLTPRLRLPDGLPPVWIETLLADGVLQALADLVLFPHDWSVDDQHANHGGLTPAHRLALATAIVNRLVAPEAPALDNTTLATAAELLGSWLALTNVTEGWTTSDGHTALFTWVRQRLASPETRAQAAPFVPFLDPSCVIRLPNGLSVTFVNAALSASWWGNHLALPHNLATESTVQGTPSPAQMRELWSLIPPTDSAIVADAERVLTWFPSVTDLAGVLGDVQMPLRREGFIHWCSTLPTGTTLFHLGSRSTPTETQAKLVTALEAAFGAPVAFCHQDICHLAGWNCTPAETTLDEVITWLAGEGLPSFDSNGNMEPLQTLLTPQPGVPITEGHARAARRVLLEDSHLPDARTPMLPNSAADAGLQELASAIGSILQQHVLASVEHVVATATNSVFEQSVVELMVHNMLANIGFRPIGPTAVARFLASVSRDPDPITALPVPAEAEVKAQLLDELAQLMPSTLLAARYFQYMELHQSCGPDAGYVSLSPTDRVTPHAFQPNQLPPELGEHRLIRGAANEATIARQTDICAPVDLEALLAWYLNDAQSDAPTMDATLRAQGLMTVWYLLSAGQKNSHLESVRQAPWLPLDDGSCVAPASTPYDFGDNHEGLRTAFAGRVRARPAEALRQQAGTQGWVVRFNSNQDGAIQALVGQGWAGDGLGALASIGSAGLHAAFIAPANNPPFDFNTYPPLALLAHFALSTSQALNNAQEALTTALGSRPIQGNLVRAAFEHVATQLPTNNAESTAHVTAFMALWPLYMDDSIVTGQQRQHFANGLTSTVRERILLRTPWDANDADSLVRFRRFPAHECAAGGISTLDPQAWLVPPRVRGQPGPNAAYWWAEAVDGGRVYVHASNADVRSRQVQAVGQHASHELLFQHIQTCVADPVTRALGILHCLKNDTTLAAPTEPWVPVLGTQYSQGDAVIPHAAIYDLGILHGLVADEFPSIQRPIQGSVRSELLAPDSPVAVLTGNEAWTTLLDSLAPDGWGLGGVGLSNCNDDPLWMPTQSILSSHHATQRYAIWLLERLRFWGTNSASTPANQYAANSAYNIVSGQLLARTIPCADARLLFRELVGIAFYDPNQADLLLDHLNSDSPLRTRYHECVSECLLQPGSLPQPEIIWLSGLIGQVHSHSPPSHIADFAAELMASLLSALTPAPNDLANIYLPTRAGNGAPWQQGHRLTVTDRTDVPPARILADACRDALNLEAAAFEPQGQAEPEIISVREYLVRTGRFDDAAIRPLLGVLAWVLGDEDAAAELTGRTIEQLLAMTTPDRTTIPVSEGFRASLLNTIEILMTDGLTGFNFNMVNPPISWLEIRDRFKDESSVKTQFRDAYLAFKRLMNDPSNAETQQAAAHALQPLVVATHVDSIPIPAPQFSPSRNVEPDQVTSILSMTNGSLALDFQSEVSTLFVDICANSSDVRMKPASSHFTDITTIYALVAETVRSFTQTAFGAEHTAAANRMLCAMTNGPVQLIEEYRNDIRNVNEWMNCGVQELDNLLSATHGHKGTKFWDDIFALAAQNASFLADVARAQIVLRGYRATSPLFELLQNADDAVTELRHLGHQATVDIVSLNFGSDNEDTSPEYLEFMHFGRPIGDVHLATAGNSVPTAKQQRWRWDLRAMLRWGQGTKVTPNLLDASNEMVEPAIETGQYGLGFKSIFIVTREPIIASGVIPPFRIIGGRIPEILPQDNDIRSQLQQRLEDARANTHSPVTPTLFRLPLRDKVWTEMWPYFNSNYRYALLFCRNVRTLTINCVDARWTPSDIQPPGDIASLVRTFPANSVTPETRVLVAGSGFGKLVFFLDAQNRVTDVPNDLPRVWVLAPTRADAARIPFLVNASFELNEGRGDIRTDGNQGPALAELGAAINDFMARLEKTQEPHRTQFLKSLWRACFRAELPASGSAATVVRDILWGTNGLLCRIAAQFGAPDRVPVSLSDTCNLIQVATDDTCLLAKGALADAMRNPSWSPTQTPAVATQHGHGGAPVFIGPATDLQGSTSSQLTLRDMLVRLGATIVEATQAHLVTQAATNQTAQAIVSNIVANAGNAAVAESIQSGTLSTLKSVATEETLTRIHQVIGETAPTSSPGPTAAAIVAAQPASIDDDAVRNILHALSESAPNHHNDWHHEWHHQGPDEMRQALESGPQDAKRTTWMRLFTLASSQVIGRQTPVQHRDFITHLRNNGTSGGQGSWWYRLFEQGPPNEDNWFGVIREWAASRVGGSRPYDHWMTLLPELFVASQYLDQYVQLLNNTPHHPNQTPGNLLRPLIDPEYSGTGFDAPALPRLRGNWLLRELIRINYFGQAQVDHLYPLCFQNSARLRNVLRGIGCDLGSAANDANLTSTELWTAWTTRCHALGFEDMTLGGTFDLALRSDFMWDRLNAAGLNQNATDPADD